MKIKSIERIPYSGDLLNLQVKDTHNYFLSNGVLVGNCHGAKAKSIKEIAENCINADYRIGVTGTMPLDPLEYKTIQSGLGRVLLKITDEQMIDKGVLSQLTIANILLKYSQETIENCKNREYPEEIRLLKEHPLRNRVFKWIFSNIPDTQNTLILCNNLDKIDELKKYFEENLDKKYNIRIITGKVKTDNRESIRKEIENEENVIILATYGTMSTGVNIKKLHNLIFAEPRKSYVSVMQSIGRGLRTHEQKEKLIVFDIVDDLSYYRKLTRGPRKGLLVLEKNYCLKQFEERLQIYNNQKFEYFTKRVDLSSI